MTPKPVYDTRTVFNDPMAVLKLAHFRLGKRVGDNQMVECPFHAGDKTPSCSVELQKGVFRCHGCDAKGTLPQLIAQKYVGSVEKVAVDKVMVAFKEYLQEINTKIIDRDMVEAYREALAENAEARLTLCTSKLLTPETLARFDIGWDGERYSIPVYDLQGNCVNVRYRSLDPAQTARKCINHEGHGSPARLYPLSQVYEHEKVFITEGEPKALLLAQMFNDRGYGAATGTGGAGKWHDDWNYHFRDKDVVILFDVDAVGEGHGSEVARGLLGVAKSVKVVRLPLDKVKHPHGDVTDWVKEGGTADQLEALIAETPLYKYQPLLQSEDITNLPIARLKTIGEVTAPQRHNQHVEFDAVIAAEEYEPFRVPVEWEVVCRRNQKCCSKCPIKDLEDGKVGLRPHYRLEVLRLVDVPEHRRDDELRKITEIPNACAEHALVVKETANVQIMELVPDISEASTRSTSVPAYLIQKVTPDFDKELHGSLHTIRGFPTSDPKSGRVIVLAYEANPSNASIDRFEVTPEIHEGLKKFQVAGDEPTLEAVEAKVKDIYDDISAHVTHVVGRHDLHIAYDLAYHSVIGFHLSGRDVKGWVETLIVGDTGQGKSVAATALREWYALGDIAVGGNCTAAGLLGAVMESMRRKRWVYHLGKLPLNDGKLLFIEELSGMTTDLFRKLRDARSSGRHEDTKAKLTRIMTRTRIIAITNPRGGRMLAEYQQGIVALQHLFEEMADVRRFDFAYFAAHGEVDPASIRNGAVHGPQRYPRLDAQRLVMWAWSRKPNQVEFTAAARTRLRDQGLELAKKYTRKIPLVIDTEQDEKLARLAAALAARLYSTDDSETLVVHAAHVDYVAKYLDRIYSTGSCAYDKFSTRIFAEDNVSTNGEVIDAVKALYNAAAVVEFLLETETFSNRDVAHISDVPYDIADKFLGILLRNRAIRPTQFSRDTYRKTTGFTTMLRGLLTSGILVNETPDQRFDEEGY